METQQEYTTVDWRKVFKEIWKRKKIYAIVLPNVFVLACIYILSIPRTYDTDTSMAPEVESPSASGSLSDIASSFGLDISDMQSADAITPLLYPNLMDDNGFVSKTFNIFVTTQDGTVKTSYYDYLKNHQKHSWMENVKGSIGNLFKKEKKEEPKGKFNPYRPSKKDDEIISKIRKNIKFSVDKKTGLITISVTDQDPLIAKTIADSMRSRLQEFITKYRTNKAVNDYNHYKKLVAQAKADYEKVRRAYGSYSDANMDVVLESYHSKQEDLENDMQLKFNAYSALVNQMNAARAKVQERTPVFTIVKGAAVPIKPTAPKRMVFVIIWVFIAFLGISLYVLRDIIFPKN